MRIPFIGVSDLRETLEALRRSQAFIEFKLDGTIITANENFRRALGYELAEIVGKHHSTPDGDIPDANKNVLDTLGKIDSHRACAARRARRHGPSRQGDPDHRSRREAGHGAVGSSERSVIVSTEVGNGLVGLLVDGVSDLLTIDQARVQPLTTNIHGSTAGFAHGMIPHEIGMICFPDLGRQFPAPDTLSIAA